MKYGKWSIWEELKKQKQNKDKNDVLAGTRFCTYIVEIHYKFYWHDIKSELINAEDGL